MPKPTPNSAASPELCPFRSLQNPVRDRIIIGLASVAALIVLIASCRTAFNAGTTGDFPIFWTAAQAMSSGESLEAAGEIGYVYPPLFAAMLSLLVPLGQGGAAIVWSAASFLILISALLIGARDAVERWGLVRRPIGIVAVALIGGLLTIILFRAVFRGGQSDHLLVFGFAVGLSFVDRRPALAGLALGMAANIKYTALGMVPLLLMRRKYKAAAWTVGSSIGWAMVPALISGWRLNLENLALAARGFLKVLGVEPDPGEVAANLPEIGLARSVSLTSLFSRWLLPVQGHAVLYASVAVAALACLSVGWWLYHRSGRSLWTTPVMARPSDAAVFSLEWAGLVVAMLVFSPQTQVRHLVVLVGVHLIAAAMLMRWSKRWLWIMLALGAFQFTLVFPSSDLNGAAWVSWGRSVGLQIWSTLLMFFVLLWVGLREADRIDAERAPSMTR